MPPRRPLIWPWLVLLLLLVAAGIAAAYLLTRDDESETTAPTTVVVTGGPTTVEVTVSSEPRQVPVPRVTGLTEAAATARLDSLGFDVSVSRIQSSRPRGIVIAQEPRPRTRARRGSVVGINVSRGPATTTTATTTTTNTTTTTQQTGRPIPSVVGLAQRDAVARLQGAGFRVDSFPTASRRPRGTVLLQRPGAGRRAAPNSLVEIAVSLGSGERPLRTIPDVTGMPESEAKQRLVEVGFTVRSVDQPAADSSEREIVLSQTPEPGGQASAGSQIVLSVGR